MRNNSDILNKDERDFLSQGGLYNSKAVRLQRGISNNNYLIENKYVFKSPYDNRFLSLDKGQIELQHQAFEHFISPQVIAFNLNKGYLLTSYLKGYNPIDIAKITLAQVINIVKAIKVLHSLKKGDLKELNYEESLDSYRLSVDPKDRLYFKQIEYSPLLKNNCEITHFDLVDNNILTDEIGNIQLIDFELAIYAPKYFDLISLLYENAFSPQIKQAIVTEYFKDDKEGKDEFLSQEKRLKQIADLYWYHWAKARSYLEDPSKSIIYNSIASDKKESLLKSLKEN